MKTIFMIIVLIVLQSFSLSAEDIRYLQFNSLEVTHTYNGKSKEVEIRREIDSECININIVNDTVFSGDYANEKVPKKCKKTFITTLGTVQPIEIFGIKTVAELEVLQLLEYSSYEPKKYVLVDARREEWYLDATIPSAVNIPYTQVKYDSDFPEDFEKLIKTFNIKVIGDIEDAKFNFSEAKTAIVFCNGNWCKQSITAIKELLELGYPKEKIMWYRGGIQDWHILGFTTISGGF